MEQRRLSATPLDVTRAPFEASPAWREQVLDPAAAQRFWDETTQLPLLGERQWINGVDMVEVSFLAWVDPDAETLVHVNSLTDNMRRSFEPWLMRPVVGSPLRALDLWLPVDGCYSYRIVTTEHIPRDIGHTREGWRWVHEQGRPDPRNPERIVDPLGRFSSVWRGPDSPTPTCCDDVAEWQHVMVDCPDQVSRPISIRRGSGDGSMPLLVLFDGEQWRSTGVADRLGTPVLAALDVVLIDAMSFEARWRDLTSPRWADQVRAILARVASILGRSTEDPARVILAGQSLGGLAAARLALGPDRVADRAVCQSGSYWWRDGAKDPGRPGRIIEELAGAEAGGSHLVVQVGIDEEEMVERSREFTAAARDAGAQVCHQEWRGGHDYAWWRDGLVVAVTALVDQLAGQS